MPVSERAWEIIRPFQDYVKNREFNKIKNFSTADLRYADEQLGTRDVYAGWRLAIQNRIKDLEQEEQRKHESKVRSWNLVVGIIVGLLIAGFAEYIFGT